MTDEEILDAIASVCNFNRAEVDRWRTEALIIGRAVEKAAERQALERAAQCAERKAMDCHTLGNAEEFRELAACIRALIEQSASKEKQ